MQLILRTVHKWQRDQCLEMGAALAYYALFSLFPILLVMLSTVGFFLGPTTNLVNQILLYAQVSLPAPAFTIVEDVVLNLNANSLGAGITGFILLFITASNVFSALSRSVNKIWQVHPSQQASATFSYVVLHFIKDRLLAFLLVLCSSLLMMMSMFANILVNLLRKILNHFTQWIDLVHLDEVTIVEKMQIGATFLILSLIVMVLFKILPTTPVRWGDTWLGALLTTSALMLLQHLVSNSVIHIGSQYRSYGVVGGVMVLMVWLYLTCQVFFIGSEFTYIYAHLFGSRRGRSLPFSPLDHPRP